MQKLFTGILLVGLLASCNPDENTGVNQDDETLTSQEASAKIDVVAEEAGDDIMLMVESEGIDAIVSFLELFEDFDQFASRTDQKSWVKRKLLNVNQFFVENPAARVTADDDFTFEDIVGEYEWNSETGTFELIAESTSFIVRFPTEGSSTNNATLTIDELSFVIITEEDEFDTYEIELPTGIEGNLVVDGTEYVSVDLEATWTNAAFPDQADLAVTLSDFQYTVSLDDLQAVETSVSASISKSAQTIMAVDVTVEFESTDKVSPVLLDGFVQYSDLKIEGDLDARDVEEDGDPNDYIDLALFVGEQKLGDVIFQLEEVEPGFEDYVAYVQYEDGSLENLEDLLEPILEDIEQALEELVEEEV